MRKLVVSRRKLIKTLLALGAGSVFLSCPGAGRIAVAQTAGTPSPETFASLCALVTAHDNLDSDTMSAMYKVFTVEPWGPEHMTGLYAKLTAALKGGKPDALTEGEAWFARHLLTTWYLGIYYHENHPPLRITYDHALMFAPVQGVIPVPLLEAAPFGSWSEKPT